MTYFLPSSSKMDGEKSPDTAEHPATAQLNLADLKIFWGPEICRLEYLLHLLDTGRVKDDSRQRLTTPQEWPS